MTDEEYKKETLIRLVCNGYNCRDFARKHPDATEDIILLAKAMDFIEDVVR